jgi:hypothetical protein
MATASSGARSLAQEYVDNPPNARRTMEALREMGYDSYASILDLIDNSIDAGASEISVSISENKGDIIIELRDNGSGMDLETLSEALRLGSETDRLSDDLGKFGMGLVTASIGLSRKVEVFTKEQDSPCVAGGFDLDDIYERNQFVKWIDAPKSKQLGELLGQHGTFLRLSKTDRISSRQPTQFSNVLKKKIGQVYRKFLKAGVAIEVNGQLVDAIDPLLLNHPDTKLVFEAEIEIDSENTASLRVVDLPDEGPAGNKALGIIPQNSGFYIMRNNREIIEAVTFDFYKKHPDYSHFRAEVSFQGSTDSAFHTDVKKASINPSQAFLDRLRSATQALITESARAGRQRANVGKGQIDHSAAESNISKRSRLIPKPPMLIEKRKPRSAKGSTASSAGNNSERNPHITHFKTPAGLKVRFEEGDYGSQNAFYLVNQEKATIVVTYNREHPFWRELVEHASESRVIAILDYLVFALANTELLVPEEATVVKANVNTTLVGLLV